MFRRVSMIAAGVAICFCTNDVARAQYGGLRVQVGGYSNGMRMGGYGYGNGFNSTYGNIYLNGLGNQNYGNPYNNVYNGGYYNNGLPYTGFYPNFGSSYVAPYYAPVRPYAFRRYRYR